MLSTALHAKNHDRPQRPAEQNGRTVLVPNDILHQLKPAADQRGISVNELVRRLLDTAAFDSLVDAILDEGEIA
ncbi:hypothetical protein [Pseudooceanicola sp. MF1-13]|uniref:hypothetical protein n=1 Tax=Pseudooceanicola sp. MF1-13 TaxID=3379095 RepID=UPI0038926886